MARISAVKRRNAWRRAIREGGVLFVAFGLGSFAFTIFNGTMEKEPLKFLQVFFLAIFLNVAGLLAINHSIETEEEEVGEEADERILEENVEHQREVGEGESRGFGRRLKDVIYEGFGGLGRRHLATNIRNALIQLAHPGRNPRSRP